MTLVAGEEELEGAQDVAMDLVGEAPVAGADPGVDAARRRVRVEVGEIPAEHEVAMGRRRRRVTTDRQVAKEPLVLVGKAQIVVRRERREPQRLAEAARTQEEEAIAQFLEDGNAIRAVDVELSGRTRSRAHCRGRTFWGPVRCAGPYRAPPGPAGSRFRRARRTSSARRRAAAGRCAAADAWWRPEAS